MRQPWRIFQTLSILVFYCSAVVFHSNHDLLSKAQRFNETQDQKKSFLSIASANLVSYTTKSENLHGHLNHGSFCWYDHASQLASYRLADTVRANKLSEYLSLCRQIVIRLPRTDIIFPFHYFL